MLIKTSPAGEDTVEEGAIDDIPSAQDILTERIPIPSPRHVAIPKGVIVGPLEGTVAIEEDPG
jgi:hypothetical protein